MKKKPITSAATLKKIAAFIRQYTSAKERMEIANKHGVKTRAQISNILLGKNANDVILNAMLKLAEINEQAYKEAAKDFEARVTALGL